MTRTRTSTRFFHRATLNARKLASFWQEKRHSSRRFGKTVVESKQVKTSVAVLAFFDANNEKD